MQTRPNLNNELTIFAMKKLKVFLMAAVLVGVSAAYSQVAGEAHSDREVSDCYGVWARGDTFLFEWAACQFGDASEVIAVKGK